MLITVSGEPGCRHEELARLLAQRLRAELINESRLLALVEEEYGSDERIPDRAFPLAAASVLLRLATEHPLVVSVNGAELLLKFPFVLKVHITASRAYRAGTLMIDHSLERQAALQLLRQMEAERKAERRRRFSRSSSPPHLFDLVLNAEGMNADQMASFVETVAVERGLQNTALLSRELESQQQFRLQVQLARLGIHPKGKASLKKRPFMHPSEEIFANLLDFYRIEWQYEPRSFPIQWDDRGQVQAAFTPDFYLPEFDLYVELTTMKQSLVTKKNRKVKLLKSLYPDINIQVFYEKDFRDLIFKYGLAEQALKA
ncbi:MAG: cytidylate kinase family protein [Bryobacteraceae bacterium]|nr:cytidylate kinase family protein [Bryobacteraceae bacterium]